MRRPAPKRRRGLELEIYRHLWGVTDRLEDAVERIQAEGYVGIEHDLPDPSDRDRFNEVLSSASLAYIPAIYTEGLTVAEHLDSLSQQVDLAAAFEPRFITAQAGLDRWSIDETLEFLEPALALEAEVGVPIAHETHRGRVLFNPWRAREVLERLPDLKLCCDYSHWVVVAERLIDEETEIRELCAERCLHIHARVGYEEGPQVPDPRAPEYQEHLAAHERWWDEIWAAQERRGMPVTTLTPEYGSDGYVHTLPYTAAPVADLWTVSLWQAVRERTRFANRQSG
jgi:hypothetical protein